MMRLAGLAVGLALWTAAAEAACNKAPDPCEVAGGTYHVILPEGATGAVPAVMMLHGFTGSGRDVMGTRTLVDVVLARGYAIIAPDGEPRPNGPGRSWSFHPDRPAVRDETAFLLAVARDASARFGIDRDRMLLAGFSIGGSMVSYLACAQPAAFAAYAPVAGSFWRPHPRGCAGPVRLFHTHGLADRTVPLEGREVAPGFRQGNVYEAMEIWRATDGCAEERRASVGIFDLRQWEGCRPGAALSFALHDGGHSVPDGWAALALDWFEGR